MSRTCYFGSEACRRGHLPSCPAATMDVGDRIAFFGNACPPLSLDVADTEPVPLPDPEPVSPVAPAPARKVHGGYVQGGRLVPYAHPDATSTRGIP